jgi:hypothetical protein
MHEPALSMTVLNRIIELMSLKFSEDKYIVLFELIKNDPYDTLNRIYKILEVLPPDNLALSMTVLNRMLQLMSLKFSEDKDMVLKRMFELIKNDPYGTLDKIYKLIEVLPPDAQLPFVHHMLESKVNPNVNDTIILLNTLYDTYAKLNTPVNKITPANGGKYTYKYNKLRMRKTKRKTRKHVYKPRKRL